MMEEKTCCVTGHRDIPPERAETVGQALGREVARAYEDGFRVFLSGFADGADLLFAAQVVSLRRLHPEVRLGALLPYPQRQQSLRRRPDAAALLDACAEVIVTGPQYSPGVFSVRNRRLVERSSRVIAVYDGRVRGGTAQTVRLARQLGREVVVVAP